MRSVFQTDKALGGFAQRAIVASAATLARTVIVTGVIGLSGCVVGGGVSTSEPASVVADPGPETCRVSENCCLTLSSLDKGNIPGLGAWLNIRGNSRSP